MASVETLFCFGCFLLLSFSQIGHSEIFTALAELERVLYAEENLARNIRNYIAEEERRLEMLRNIASDYEQHSTEALQDASNHLANPVNAFLLVKRFTSDWYKVEALIRNNTSDPFLQGIGDTLNLFPDQEDLEGAATALLRLQDTYALPTNKLARGEIKGVKHSPELTAEDCFELGKIAYNQNDHYHTIMWMEQALEFNDNDPQAAIDRSLVIDYLAFSAFMEGKLDYAHQLTLSLLDLEPDHIRAQNNLRYYEQLMAEKEQEAESRGESVAEEEIQNEKPVDDYHQSEEFKTYEALCRGEETHEIPGKHRLTCQYKRPHPYFNLRPLKEETIYFDPHIVIYHDVLVDDEMNKVKELAAPKLQRATVQNPQTGVLETAFYRVSKSAWLSDEDDELIASITSKVKAITGLTMDTAEELQVVNYGIGGHYEPHYDFARKEEMSFADTSGNRILTGICYMTDVEAGGATVFPQIGVKLWPVKGTLAVWYNLRRNGDGDFNTRHAACPVLTGQKWICNKWLHERGQEFARPCSLNPEE